MTQAGSTMHYMVGLLRDKYGWAPEAVSMKALQSVTQMKAAVKGGQDDAAPLPAHNVAKLVAEGDARLIRWVHEHKPWQLGGPFTSPRNAAERRPEVGAGV